MKERTLLEFLQRPPRESKWWTALAPTCAGCGHTVVEHDIREADRGCDVIGCDCAAFRVEDDR